MVILENETIITNEYIIKSYEIWYVNLKLNESANIYIMIFYDNTETIEKNFTFIVIDYQNWTSDEYLYEYINTNIVKIFNN